MAEHLAKNSQSSEDSEMKSLICQMEDSVHDSSDIFASLNVDVLLKILSFCDPWDVCRCSRVSRSANLFVDSNFFRLPQLHTLLKIFLPKEDIWYRLQTEHVWAEAGVLLKFESNTADVQRILSQAKYAIIDETRIDGYPTDPVARFRSLMEEILLVNSGSCDFRIETQWSPRFSRVDFLIEENNTTARQYLADLSQMPQLELIFSNEAPTAANEHIYELFARAYQVKFSTVFWLTSAFTDTQQCLGVVAKLLKDVAMEPELRAYFYAGLRQTLSESENVETEVMQYYVHLKQKIEEYGLTSCFSMKLKYPSYLTIRPIPKTDSYEILIRTHHVDSDSGGYNIMHIDLPNPYGSSD